MRVAAARWQAGRRSRRVTGLPALRNGFGGGTHRRIRTLCSRPEQRPTAAVLPQQRRPDAAPLQLTSDATGAATRGDAPLSPTAAVDPTRPDPGEAEATETTGAGQRPRSAPPRASNNTRLLQRRPTVERRPAAGSRRRRGRQHARRLLPETRQCNPPPGQGPCERCRGEADAGDMRPSLASSLTVPSTSQWPARHCHRQLPRERRLFSRWS